MEKHGLTQPSILCEQFKPIPLPDLPPTTTPFPPHTQSLELGRRKNREVVEREEVREIVLEKCILKVLKLSYLVHFPQRCWFSREYAL